MLTEVKDEIQTSQEFLPFEMGYLPEFFQQKAEIELNETPEKREEGIRLLREMARNDKILSEHEFDDDFLLQFLRCRKFNIAKSFSNIKDVITFKKRHPKMFTDIHFQNISVGVRKNIVTFLPRRCPDGCAIMLVELDKWIPEEFPLDDVKRHITVLFLQALREPMTQVNGFKIIFDAKGNPFRQLRYATPTNMYLLYYGTQICVPGRTKEIHIVNNTSIVFQTAWIFLRIFMSEKTKKRFVFHSTKDSLLSYFPSSVLPVEYGGDLEDYDMTEWLRKVTQPERLETLAGRFVKKS